MTLAPNIRLGTLGFYFSSVIEQRMPVEALMELSRAPAVNGVREVSGTTTRFWPPLDHPTMPSATCVRASSLISLACLSGTSRDPA